MSGESESAVKPVMPKNGSRSFASIVIAVLRLSVSVNVQTSSMLTPLSE